MAFCSTGGFCPPWAHLRTPVLLFDRCTAPVKLPTWHCPQSEMLFNFITFYNMFSVFNTIFDLHISPILYFSFQSLCSLKLSLFALYPLCQNIKCTYFILSYTTYVLFFSLMTSFVWVVVLQYWNQESYCQTFAIHVIVWWNLSSSRLLNKDSWLKNFWIFIWLK